MVYYVAMTKSHACKLCGQPASVHLTQIIGNQVTKMDICEDCAQKQGMVELNPLSLMATLGKQILSDSFKKVMNEVSCPECGCTLEQFKQRGRLGCAKCYEAFQPVLEWMVKDNYGKSVLHKGKRAERALSQHILAKDLTKLEEDLKSAVDEERFEEAAKLRDAIKALKVTHS